MPFDPTSVVNTAIVNLPAIVALIKALHSQAQPDAPALTDAEVLDAFHQAVASSLAKDDAWMAAHPDPSTPKP